MNNFVPRSAVEVGPLITRIAKSLGAQLGEHLTLLLRAVLDRLVLTRCDQLQCLLYA